MLIKKILINNETLNKHLFKSIKKNIWSYTNPVIQMFFLQISLLNLRKTNFSNWSWLNKEKPTINQTSITKESLTNAKFKTE